MIDMHHPVADLKIGVNGFRGLSNRPPALPPLGSAPAKDLPVRQQRDRGLGSVCVHPAITQAALDKGDVALPFALGDMLRPKFP